MWTGTPLFPEQASTMAGRVDALYFFLLAVSTFFSLLIAGLIVYYAVKYRRRAPNSIGAVVHGGTARWVPAIDTNRIALIGVITATGALTSRSSSPVASS